ncbi:MAG TPA: hypothetical protein DHU96_27895 [Actinobacteria bacterium]|nr:hypothetical protein [Actinomycetota bacterium]
MNIASSSGRSSTATTHQETAASDSGLNTNKVSGIKMAGRLPNNVRRVRSSARHVAARSARMDRQASGQLYRAILASTQASAVPNGSRWPASTHIRYDQLNPWVTARSKKR